MAKLPSLGAGMALQQHSRHGEAVADVPQQSSEERWRGRCQRSATSVRHLGQVRVA